MRFLERRKVARRRMAEPIFIKYPDVCRVLLLPVFLSLSEQRGCGWHHLDLRERFPAAGVGSQVFPWKAVLGALCICFAKS